MPAEVPAGAGPSFSDPGLSARLPEHVVLLMDAALPDHGPSGVAPEHALKGRSLFPFDPSSSCRKAIEGGFQGFEAESG